jgi:hypothetical protein
MVPRPLLRALLAASMVASVGCEATAPPPRPARTVGNSRRVGPASARAASGEQGPPRVDSAARCAPEAVTALRRVTQGHQTRHFGPLCTDVYNGRFSAMMATGDGVRGERRVGACSTTPRGDEVHRVRRFPVGARVGFGRIVQGWVYLLGRSNALEDMPAGAQLLTIFPLPRPGDTRPPRWGSSRPSRRPSCARRTSTTSTAASPSPMPQRDPAARDAERTITEHRARGPQRAPRSPRPEGAPTLRAWQVGMFQETDYVSPQGDPASPRLARTR